ncbi:putative BRCT domain-containing protein [Helianthus annuus]|nr:putative BRCT domain-containing protein [Helianthus annuus]
MRSLLGFRPPHFSEEEAWLPAWLQPSTISPPPSSSSSSAQEIQQIATGGGNGHDGTLHLFLSGDPMSFPSSSTNHQVQYHLHLSSNEESLSRSQADKSEPLLVQQPEARVIPEEGALPSQQKGDFEIAHPKSPSFKERCRKVDISDAVELAVAASEALTIHKLLKDELLVASSVLEAAIRLKQVDFDFLSDVDDLTMADAYEDVGLTVDLTGYGSLSIVNDSFASENYISNAKHKGNECGGSHNDSDSISPKQNANLASDVDPVFNRSDEQCAPEVDLQREGFSMTPSHTNSKSNGKRQDKMTNLVSDRFQSRWFGGWTWKNEVSIPVVTDDNNKRSVPEPFANETSYLSESAPDMSSCMQRRDKDKTVSQSNAAPQHAYEKANDNGNLISDDVAVSPMDPLCSAVPCSFSLDNVVSQNSQHQEHLGPAVEPNLDNLQVNGDSSPTIHRQVASLKTYSMLHPRCEPYVDKEHTSSFEHNQTAVALTSRREKENAKVSRKVESIVPRRKRVRFSETEICYPQVKKFRKTPQTRLKDPLVASRRSKSRPCDKDNKTLLQDLTFLLTGFSVKKHKQIKILIQNNGGLVLDDIPSPSTSRRKRCSKLPLILCPKKLLTTKFLYGCAINAGILEITWLFDSVDKGLILPHQRYKILNDRSNENHLIFDNIAIMLHGKQDFCSKMGKVIKHGGGSVFKTFHWLVKSLDSKKVSAGVIVMENENSISRQLKQCALEQKVPVMPFNWIINSLYAGRLLPSPQLKLPGNLIHVESSEEI